MASSTSAQVASTIAWLYFSGDEDGNEKTERSGPLDGRGIGRRGVRRSKFFGWVVKESLSPRIGDRPHLARLAMGLQGLGCTLLLMAVLV
jgi:hypothetical protein